MSMLRRWLSRTAGVFSGARRDRELTDELEEHLQSQIDVYVRRGMSPEEARRLALATSGGIESAKEAYRDQRGVPFIANLSQDVRYALRTLRKSPAFSIVAVVSLALAIGANTAVFSLTNAALLEPLPVENPGDLVYLNWVSGPDAPARSIDGSSPRDPVTGARTSTSFSMPAFQRLRERTTSLSHLFAFSPVEQLNVEADGSAEIADGQLVTGEYHAGLGVRAARGRTITPDDDRPGAAPVAVITDEYWERRFQRDPRAIGRTVVVNGVTVTIVGVTSPAFAGTMDIGQSPDLTLPMRTMISIRRSETDLSDARFWWVRIMGRRAPGVSEAQAHAELEPIFQQSVLESLATSPTNRQRTLNAVRLRVFDGSQGLGEGRSGLARSLVLMSIVVGLVLLIACANVANLLLTRSAARHREIAVRLALGADRARIVKQLLVESLVLVLFAEVLGLVFAVWGKNLLRQLRPDAAALDVALDLRVLAVATALSVITALLFGLVPALRATRADVVEGFKAGGGARARNALFSRGLVVAQIAMSVVLLVYAGLFGRSLANVYATDTGFRQERLLLFRVDPRLSGYDGAAIPDLYQRMLDRIGAVPGVEAASFTRHAQLTGGRRTEDITFVGDERREAPDTPANPVGPGFFDAMQLPIVVGRPFRITDDAGRPRVAIVNEAFARAHFGGANPIGRRIRFRDRESEIVGVARDARYYSIRAKGEPIVYLPYVQEGMGQASFFVRTRGDPTAVVPALRTAIRELDRSLPLFEIQTQRQALNTTLADERLFAKLATFFGGVAVVLACIGVYGVVSYSTTRRTGEIGIRIALGALGRDIVWMVMRRTVVLVSLGVVIGLAAGIQGTRLFTKLLYELSPTDPVSIAGAVGVIVVVAFAAAYVPADRARRVSPMVALRLE
jgi:predicted permease